jgi:hypothetical protein
LADILFLESPIYLISLLPLAIFVGLLKEVRVWHPIIAFTLFAMFATDQLIFRLAGNLEPNRLLGQLIYFGLFCLMTAIVVKIRNRWIG